MDGFKLGLPPVRLAEPFATLASLESKVSEEADATVRACPIEASLIHRVLDTRYAERFSECEEQSAISLRQAWIEEHRLW